MAAMIPFDARTNSIPTGTRALCSSSGGKDSLLALWYATRLGVRTTTLLTMFDETGLRSRSHAVPRGLMEAQADSLGMKLVGPSASWEDYETVFIATLRELAAARHELAVFGDIDVEAHREWEQRVCAAAGLRCFLPLWQLNRRALADESLALGFRALVVCVDSRHLDDSFCGREFDAQFIADLPADVDPCGENGEFHTFVYAGPLLRKPLSVRVTGKEEYVAPPKLGSVRYCFASLSGG